MPFVGNKVTVRPKEDCDKSYDWLQKTQFAFFSQNAFTAPTGRTYVGKLFEQAPEAKRAVEGKLGVVTGVTVGGAGYHTAEALALQAGMHVVLMGRNETKLEESIAAIKKEAEKRGVPEPTLYETKYDLNSLRSAKVAADYAVELAKEKYDGKLQVLVNNAGGVASAPSLTEEGIETNVGRNYICPHYLTELLIPTLKKASAQEYKPRVVHVASIAHMFGNDLDPNRLAEHPKEGGAPEGAIKETDDGNGIEYIDENIMSAPTMYGRAKMGLVADAIRLAKLHPEINFTSQQPGSILSNFGRNMGIGGMVYYYGFYFFQFSSSQGSRTSLRAALDPDFNTEPDLQGAYLHSDGNPWTPKDPNTKNPATDKAFTMEDFSKACYEAAEKLIAKVTK